MEYTKYFSTTQEETVDMQTTVDERMVSVRRNYKDTVFRMLFQEKAALLSLYNAVNETCFTNVDDLEITTLENAVYMGMKNDISCVFAFELSIYEHQSTVNPNMPLRDLFYVAQQLQKLVTEKNLYSSRRVHIPTPRFVVFYNGSRAMPERLEYRLSDLFQKQVEKPELELIVTVYNINPGMNEALLDGCRLLKEYMLFATRIREKRKTMDLEKAINEVVDECIKEGILADFLTKHRAEVVAMSIFEYDAEKHIRMEKEESYEDGLEAGREEGRREGKTEGKAEGKAEAILIILSQKSGLTEEVRKKIQTERDNAILDRWLKLAIDAENVATFEAEM